MNRFDPFKFDVGFTKYGNPVYVKNVPWADGWIDAKIVITQGCIDDPIGKEGLAHLFEHMFFQGTKKFPTENILLDANRKIFFDSLHGCTFLEWTFFSGRFIRRNALRAVEMLRDMIFFPLLREVNLLEQKKVVLAEMWEKYLCQAYVDIRRVWRKDLYGSHSLGRSTDLTSGDEKTINAISLEDVLESHQCHFHLGKIFFLFGGDTNLQDAIKLAEEISRGAPKGEPGIPRIRLSHWPAPTLRLREISTQEYLRSEIPGRRNIRIEVHRMLPKNANPYINDLVGDIYARLLGDTFRHELHDTYGVKVSVNERTDHDLLCIWMETEPAEYDKVRALLEKSITQFGTGKKDEHLFRRVLKDEFNKSLISELAVGRILDIAMDEILNNGRICSRKETHQLKREITFREVADFIGRELSADKLYWFVLMP